jgi:hypothetical protein
MELFNLSVIQSVAVLFGVYLALVENFVTDKYQYTRICFARVLFDGLPHPVPNTTDVRLVK